MNQLRTFRILNDDEIKKFREHARANYKPGDVVLTVYHPAWRAEAELMNLEWVQNNGGVLL